MYSIKVVLLIFTVLLFSIPASALIDPTKVTTTEEAEKSIDELNPKIEKSPKNAGLYIKRRHLFSDTRI